MNLILWLGRIDPERKVQSHNFVKKVKPWICTSNEAERIYGVDIWDSRIFLYISGVVLIVFRWNSNLLDERYPSFDCPSIWSQLREGTYHSKALPRTSWNQGFRFHPINSEAKTSKEPTQDWWYQVCGRIICEWCGCASQQTDCWHAQKLVTWIIDLVFVNGKTCDCRIWTEEDKVELSPFLLKKADLDDIVI